jgi:hypothetical protein
MTEYRLLRQFEKTFAGEIYKHRNSTLGDRIACEFYEDMYNLARSERFNRLVTERSRVTNKKNRTVGIDARRGDGVFGEIVPNVEPKVEAGYAVARGPLATLEIGIETKILSKAMIKQIDRVIGDAQRQAEIFREHGRPICIAIIGINYATKYVSFEGDRQFATTGEGDSPHPVQEAAAAERLVIQKLRPHFDHFLLLRFRVTNEPPYPFEWVNYQHVFQEYGAILTRACIEYERLA